MSLISEYLITNPDLGTDKSNTAQPGPGDRGHEMRWEWHRVRTVYTPPHRELQQEGSGHH